MTKNIATIGGLLIIAVAVAGLVTSRFLPMQYPVPLAILHLLSGAAALYVGLNAMPASARTFCTFFGGGCCLLAVVVFILNSSDRALFPLLLDARTFTGLAHLLVGAVFLAGPLIETGARPAVTVPKP